MISTVLYDWSNNDQLFSEVYCKTREDEIMNWGWAEEERNQFLHTQYLYQKQSYQMQYPNMESKVITFMGEPVGRLLIEKNKDHILLIDISIFPNFQRKGIGSTLINKLQEEATLLQVPLRLSVLHNNPAQILYQQLGFKVINHNEIYLQMEWRSKLESTKKY